MGKNHVTKAEAKAVADYAANVCNALAMPRWRILVMENPCNEDANASIDWVDGVHTAQLWLSAEWMTLDYTKRREVITHEVIHLLHARVSDAALKDSQSYMRDHEHADWSRRVMREFELMVDHLAWFLAETHTLAESWDTAHGKTHTKT